MNANLVSKQKLFKLMRLGPVWESREPAVSQHNDEMSSPASMSATSGLLVMVDQLQDKGLKLTHEMMRCIGLSAPDGFDVFTTDDFDRKQLIDKIQETCPTMLLAMGQKATLELFQGRGDFNTLRGKVQQASLADTVISVIVTEHPDFLRQHPIEKRKVWDDVLLIKAILNP